MEVRVSRSNTSRLFRLPPFRPHWALLLLLVSAGFEQTLAARAQESTGGAPGCTPVKDTYRCNLGAFESRLASAHTVAVQAQPMDRFTVSQLRQMAESLGKNVAARDQPQTADLIFVLVPIESNGVDFGPSDHGLGTLQVYGPGPGGSRGTLLWSETFRGQADRPWPTVVHALIEQFRSRLAAR